MSDPQLVVHHPKATTNERHDRVVSIIVSFIMFLVMVVAASIPAVIISVIWLMSQSSDPLVTSTSAGMTFNPDLLTLSTLWTMVFTPVLSLLALCPSPVRRAISWNHGLGTSLSMRVSMRTSSEWMGWLKATGIGVMVSVIVFMLLQVMGWAVKLWHPTVATSNDMTQQIVSAIKTGPWYQGLIFIVCSGVLAPIVEELVFRGVIARSWLRLATSNRGRWLAILGSGSLFASAHFLSAGFSLDPSVILTILITWLLGSVLAWMMDRYDSIWPGVIAHVVYNTAGLMIAILV